MVTLQMTVAGLAAIAQYDLGRRLHGHGAGLLAAGLLVANPDISRWHTFLLTDSLYTSMVVPTLWAVHLAAIRRKALWSADGGRGLGPPSTEWLDDRPDRRGLLAELAPTSGYGIPRPEGTGVASGRPR